MMTKASAIRLTVAYSSEPLSLGRFSVRSSIFISTFSEGHPLRDSRLVDRPGAGSPTHRTPR